MTSSTWSTQAETGEWNTPSNWENNTVPTDTATFSSSTQTTIVFDAQGAVTVDAIDFGTQASSYTFMFNASSGTPALTIEGSGVSNSAQCKQQFIVASTSSGYTDAQLQFTNSANAGGTNLHYTAGPTDTQGYGGGVISFCNTSSAGSANFEAWTGAGIPPENGSTVGGEIAFCDSSTAATATFTIYGSLGTDGDTFGNVVFHNASTAAHATFTNVGGTVSGGDGGNTQFYGTSTAAFGVYYNKGATHDSANGGDVAFDSNATGGQGQFHNYPAAVTGGYGGVTSFNNNPPNMDTLGASAGQGFYYNYGAQTADQGGGGHTEFSAKHGSPTAENGSFVNCGCGAKLDSHSSAGHTIFSINLPTIYRPTAGNGLFWNHPGLVEGAPAGYTEFSVYGDGTPGSNIPTAENGTFINLGANSQYATGGYTTFSGSTTAGSAQLIALGGTNEGNGGRINFYDNAQGESATVQLYGNGTLNISDHTGGLQISSLEATGGTIEIQLGTTTTDLTLTGDLILKSSSSLDFYFWKKDSGGFEPNTAYAVLTAANLSQFSASNFTGNSVDGLEPTFTVSGNTLTVSFNQN